MQLGDGHGSQGRWPAQHRRHASLSAQLARGSWVRGTSGWCRQEPRQPESRGLPGCCGSWGTTARGIWAAPWQQRSHSLAPWHRGLPRGQQLGGRKHQVGGEKVLRGPTAQGGREGVEVERRPCFPEAQPPKCPVFPFAHPPRATRVCRAVHPHVLCACNRRAHPPAQLPSPASQPGRTQRCSPARGTSARCVCWASQR